jgi:hypothetical protein
MTVPINARLRLHMNVGNLNNLPPWSAIPAREGPGLYAGIKAAGYHGMQVHAPDPAIADAGLDTSGLARILDPGGVDAVAAQHKAWGFVATTLHLGHGLESDQELDRYAAATLEAQARHGYPLYVETHRATITQDMRRTLDLVARFPDLRFNADLSNWYTGQEMTYGDFGARVDALEPVFSRVRFMHGRIGDSCCAQTPLTDGEGRELPQVAHFREMWIRCFRGFLANAADNDEIIFAPELLPNVGKLGGQMYRINFARLTPDGREETDRWLEALALCALAGRCFETARAELAAADSHNLGRAVDSREIG